MLLRMITIDKNSKLEYKINVLYRLCNVKCIFLAKLG